MCFICMINLRHDKIIAPWWFPFINAIAIFEFTKCRYAGLLTIRDSSTALGMTKRTRYAREEGISFRLRGCPSVRCWTRRIPFLSWFWWGDRGLQGRSGTSWLCLLNCWLSLMMSSVFETDFQSTVKFNHFLTVGKWCALHKVHTRIL